MPLLMALVMSLAFAARDDLRASDALSGYKLLLASSAFNRGCERAAFVVRTGEGKVRFVTWNSSEHLRASYRGAIPDRTIAIAHTHPYCDRSPSRHDVTEAQRLGIPIVVITIDAVTVVRPDGSIDQLARGTSWIVARRRRGA